MDEDALAGEGGFTVETQVPLLDRGAIAFECAELDTREGDDELYACKDDASAEASGTHIDEETPAEEGRSSREKRRSSAK